MILPIEYPRPFKDKYMDEETPMFAHWVIFGTHPDGRVDISDGNQDILTRVPRPNAQKILEARNAFVNEMMELML
jgi:hypothetical protein